MAEKTKNILKILFYEAVSALILTHSVIPAFNNIGRLFYQIFLTAALVLIFLAVADSDKIKPVTVSHSLIFMTAFWVLYAVITQIVLHRRLGDKSFKWHFLFYYDKPTMIIVVYFAVFIFFAFKLLINTDNLSFIEQYRKFQKRALTAFAVYYFIIIFYCFFVIRTAGESGGDINLVPFNVFNVMKAGAYEYEFIFLFFGNIGIFLPLGILVPLFIKNKPLIIAFPFILSVGVEISQYVLKNGQTDIDDVILNVLGFFLGYFAKLLFDKAVHKISKGRLDSVFLL